MIYTTHNSLSTHYVNNYSNCNQGKVGRPQATHLAGRPQATRRKPQLEFGHRPNHQEEMEGKVGRPQATHLAGRPPATRRNLN